MKRKITICVLLAIFIGDLIFVLSGNSAIFDNMVYKFIISFKGDVLTDIFKLISFFSSTKMIVLYNIILVIGILIVKKRNILLITISSISSGVINNLVKYLVKRERPFGIALVNETFYSFPSGHAMISVLFFGMIIYKIIEHNIKYRKAFITLISIYILLVGISRIYLGVHYASDVIGGYALATAILLSLTLIYEKKYKEKKI